MNILNIILLIMGIFNLIVGITWTKKNVVNFVFKLLFLAGGGSAVAYAWYEFEKGYTGESKLKWIN